MTSLRACPISQRNPDVKVVESGAPTPEELKARFALKSGAAPIYETGFLRSMRSLHPVWQPPPPANPPRETMESRQ